MAGLPVSCRERGAAAVLAIGVIVAIVTVTVGGLLVAAAVTASQRARLAADLAAIAGATAVRDSAGLRDGCAESARVAARNGSSLVACQAMGASGAGDGGAGDGGDVIVEVTVQVAGTPWPAVARARAGPRPRG